MFFRLRVTIAEHGFDEDHAEQFLEGFVQMHPEVGPVVSQNTETGALTAIFSFDAEGLDEAIKHAVRVFRDGAEASGLTPVDVIDVQASVIPVEEQADAHQLQPA